MRRRRPSPSKLHMQKSSCNIQLSCKRIFNLHLFKTDIKSRNQLTQDDKVSRADLAVAVDIGKRSIEVGNQSGNVFAQYNQIHSVHLAVIIQVAEDSAFPAANGTLIVLAESVLRYIRFVAAIFALVIMRF